MCALIECGPCVCDHTKTLQCGAEGSIRGIPQIPTQDVAVATGMSEVSAELVSVSDAVFTIHVSFDTFCTQALFMSLQTAVV